MNVFISYAQEDRDLADRVAQSIRGRDHTVFFDRTDLPPGNNFEEQIENAINNSTLMVFLISPDSVAEGRFTLTELKIAQTRWKSAKNRILPVMIRETPRSSIPNYLRAVTILTPEGNAPAEIAREVNQLAKRWTNLPLSGTRYRDLFASFMTPFVVSVTLILILIATSLIVEDVPLPTPPQARIELATVGPIAHERGFFGNPNLYRIDVAATNNDSASARILQFSLDVDPANALIEHGGGSGFTPEEPGLVAPGLTFNSHVLVSAPGNGTTVRWRVCAHTESGEPTCTPPVEYKPIGALPYQDQFELDEHLTRHATAVSWDGASFLIAATSPDRIIRLSENGNVDISRNLEGIPLSISSGHVGTFVGITNPDKIIRLDHDTLDIEKKIEIQFPKDSSDQPISTRPVNMAQDGHNLWVLTRGGAEQNGLGVLDADLSGIQTPPYYEELSFNTLPGMLLKSGIGSVWSGDSDKMPATIRRLTRTKLTEFTGHDYEIASCATDVLPVTAGLLVPNCEGIVYMTMVSQDDMKLGRRIDRIPGFSNEQHEWPVVLLGMTVKYSYLAAITIYERFSENRYIILSTLKSENENQKILEVGDSRILDMAIGRNTVMLIIENKEGIKQLVSMGLS